MASTGNVFAGTGENNAGIGATAWTSPGNVVSDNTTDATCDAAASSQYQVARNFNFSAIPAGATIVGVTVRVEASEHSGGTESLNAQLQNESGTLVGSSQAQTLNGTTKAVYTYGSTSDLWSATLTRAIVQDADFGVRLWFTTAHDVRIDYVTVAVEYLEERLADLGKTEANDTSSSTTVHVEDIDSGTEPWLEWFEQYIPLTLIPEDRQAEVTPLITVESPWWHEDEDVGDPLSLFYDSQVVGDNAAGGELTASLDKTEANDTQASDVVALLDATLDKTEANDTLSGVATAALVADLDKTEADDTLSGVATAALVADLAITEANDTLAAEATADLIADLAKTEANDTLEAAATAALVSDLDKTEANDAISAALDETVLSTSEEWFEELFEVATEDCFIDESVTTPPPDGSASLAQTEANDTLESTAEASLAIDLDKTEADDTQAATTVALLAGDLASTEANDPLSAALDETILSVSEDWLEQLMLEPDDELLIDNYASLETEVVVNLSKTEADDTAASTAEVLLAADLNKTEADDSLSAQATGALAADLSATEANDSLSSDVGALLLATSEKTEAADTLDSFVSSADELTADLAKTEANDVITAVLSISTGGSSIGNRSASRTAPYSKSKGLVERIERELKEARLTREAAEPKPIIPLIHREFIKYERPKPLPAVPIRKVAREEEAEGSNEAPETVQASASPNAIPQEGAKEQAPDDRAESSTDTATPRIEPEQRQGEVDVIHHAEVNKPVPSTEAPDQLRGSEEPSGEASVEVAVSLPTIKIVEPEAAQETESALIPSASSLEAVEEPDPAIEREEPGIPEANAVQELIEPLPSVDDERKRRSNQRRAALLVAMMLMMEV